MNIRVFFYDGVDYSTGEMLAASVAFSENYIEFIGYELLPTDKCSIIMRGTGLKDSSGIEIYEGDKVRRLVIDYSFCEIDNYQSPKYKIEESFIVYSGKGFEVDSEDFGYHGEDLWDWDELEVIGNIYEQQTKKP